MRVLRAKGSSPSTWRSRERATVSGREAAQRPRSCAGSSEGWRSQDITVSYFYLFPSRQEWSDFPLLTFNSWINNSTCISFWKSYPDWRCRLQTRSGWNRVMGPEQRPLLWEGEETARDHAGQRDGEFRAAPSPGWVPAPRAAEAPVRRLVVGTCLHLCFPT